ncbi:hypothetical protein [uncultured Desulfovibrio sp.]|nr:hypothetical protein [uncultured Desulfovibrio sp.]
MAQLLKQGVYADASGSFLPSISASSPAPAGEDGYEYQWPWNFANK